MLERIRRFVISGAILVAAAFGVASLATAAGTAAVVANSQADKVLKKYKAIGLKTSRTVLSMTNSFSDSSRTRGRTLTASGKPQLWPHTHKQT